MGLAKRDDAAPARGTAPSTDALGTLTPVGAVLARIAYELHMLAGATDDFHHLAFRGAGATRLDDRKFVEAAQSIDLTQQILSNLSQFVECIAMAAPEDWRMNVAPARALLTLGDLQRRLGDTPEAEDVVAAATDEDDIFF